jgi:hypothetical protein
MFSYNLHEKGEMKFYLFVSVVHLPSKQLNQMETNLEKNHLKWFYLSSQIALTGEIFGTQGHKPNAPWNIRLCTNKNLHSNYCSIMSFIVFSC